MSKKRLSGQALIPGALVLSMVAATAWAEGTEVTAPCEGPTVVVRTDDSGNETNISYQAVQDNPNTIKYEGAPKGLGESGAIESDLFVIQVDDAGDTVHVKTKAGKDTAEWISGESDSDIDDNGFQIELVSISESTYTLRLTSTPAVSAALSNVTFEFFPGEQANASYD